MTPWLKSIGSNLTALCPVRSEKTYRQARAEICDTALVSLTVLSVPLLATLYWRASHSGWPRIVFIDTGLAVVLWSVTVLRRRIPYRWRAAILCTVFGMVSVVGAWTYGVVSGAFVWGMALPALTTVLFGMGAGLFSLAAIVCAYLVIGWTTVEGFRSPPIDLAFFVTSGVAWISLTLVVAATGLVLIKAMGVLDKHFQRTLEISEDNARELKESEQRYRLIFDHTPLAIMVFDPVRGVFTDVNPTAEALFQAPRRELLEKGVIDFSPERQPDGRTSQEAMKSILDRARTQGPVAFEWACRTSQGTAILCEVYLAYQGLEPHGLFWGIVQDITEKRQRERELQQAQKMEAVGQLTGGIAHDFNNLLSVCLSNLEIAEAKSRRGGDIQQYLESIERSVKRGASLTQQLLAFSRRQTLFPQNVNVGELARQMVTLLRRTLGETIEVDLHADEDLWLCKVDPSLLESAILNLAINARDAMPKGGRLTIFIENRHLNDEDAAAQDEVTPGDYVMVAVRDTGHGIPKTIRDRIFEPFFTTKEVGKGSGLGLSMVYGFVKQSHGHVSVYSVAGNGTIVRLYFPRADQSPPAREIQEVEEFPLARNETILVVEDDPNLSSVVVESLRGLGYSVLEARDGPMALEVLGATPQVDLLFTDVVLRGGMNGHELVVKAEAIVPGIAVVYASGYPGLGNSGDLSLSPDAAFLQKPYDTSSLAVTIRRALDSALACEQG